MVRLTRSSKTSNRVAGCTPSHHNTMPDSPSPAPRVTRGPSAVDREKARANAMQSRKGAEVKAKVRSCMPRQGTTSIPAADLLVRYPASLISLRLPHWLSAERVAREGKARGRSNQKLLLAMPFCKQPPQLRYPPFSRRQPTQASAVLQRTRREFGPGDPPVASQTRVPSVSSPP